MLDRNEYQPFIDHLRIEHQQLQAEIHAISAELDQPPGQVRPATVAERAALEARFAHLRNRLGAHFEREEAGGCLEEAVARLPELAADVAALERDHPRLMAELDNLIVALMAGVDGAPFRQRFRALAELLEAHEQRENGVLARGFNVNDEDFRFKPG